MEMARIRDVILSLMEEENKNWECHMKYNPTDWMRTHDHQTVKSVYCRVLQELGKMKL